MDPDTSPRSFDAPLPATFGQYVVEGVVASAREVSWMTRHLWTGRRARLRVLPADAARDPEALVRFTTRARVASALGHPGVADLVDMGSADDGTVFMAWELIEGEPLDAFLTRVGPLSIEGAERLLRPVMDALSECHARGVTHGEIDAGAIVVETRDGMPRARLVDLGHGGASPPTDDVLAVGVLLHHCTVSVSRRGGDPLHYAVNDRAAPAFERVAFEDLRPDAPAPLRAAVDRALARRPDDRHPTMGAFREALRPGRVAPPPFEVTRLDTPRTLPPGRRPPRRRSLALGVALGLGLALVGSLGLGAVVARALGAGMEPAPRVISRVAPEPAP